MSPSKYKIVYVTPALYMAGGVERVLTLKANYFAEHMGHDVTIILTEHPELPLFYKLSPKIKVVNLDIGFEDMWKCSFLGKVFVYLKKQRLFRKKLADELRSIRPDFTVSLLRREINFITKIHDGSIKIGELHVNRANYRNFEAGDGNFIKNVFAHFWMKSLVRKLKQLERFVVLTNEDRQAWPELQNVITIPDPLTFYPTEVSPLEDKRVIAVGRYAYQKGFDLLLKAWAIIENRFPDWQLAIFGQGDRAPYDQLVGEMHIDRSRCHLYGPSSTIQQEYIRSSVFAFSSRFEGFGMVLIEAMACGLPVVSFDCPCGPKDIVNHDVDGLLVESGNIEQLAEALARLMEDGPLRVRLAGKARQNVRRFDLAVLAQQWQELFDELYKQKNQK